MAHNVLSYGSPEAARRANRAINKIAQDGGFVGVKPTERRVHTNTGQGVVSSGYNGYFKIVDSSFTTDDTPPKKVCCIKIVDGALYREGMTSSDMVCMGNGARFTIPMYEKTNITSDITFYIKMTRVNEASYIYECSIVNDLETNIVRDVNNSFYQIGRVDFKIDGSYEIIQDHVTGVPSIYLIDEASFNTMLCTVQGNHEGEFPIRVKATVNGADMGYFDLFASELALIGAVIPTGTRLIGHKTLATATEGEFL